MALSQRLPYLPLQLTALRWRYMTGGCADPPSFGDEDSMSSTAPSRLDLTAAVGLAIGGALGLAGSFVGPAELRQILWAVDGVGIVVATALLTLKFFRLGNDLVAAGFLVFLAGESLLVSGNAAGLAAAVPSYGGGFALWAAGLVMTSVPRTFALWNRVVAFAAALLFRDHRRGDRLGRAPNGDGDAPTHSRLPAARPHLRRLDLDAAARLTSAAVTCSLRCPLSWLLSLLSRSQGAHRGQDHRAYEARLQVGPTTPLLGLAWYHFRSKAEGEAADARVPHRVKLVDSRFAGALSVKRSKS